MKVFLFAQVNFSIWAEWWKTIRLIARVGNCEYMYLEKCVFVGIGTLLQALCLGGGRGRGGEVVMKEIDDLRFYVLSKIFQSYQDDGR